MFNMDCHASSERGKTHAFPDGFWLRHSSKLLAVVMLLLLLSGCTSGRNLQGFDPGDLFSVKTVTLPALATALPSRTLTPTATRRSTSTSLPDATETRTPVPIFSPTPVVVDILTMLNAQNDKLELVEDVTIPDGSILRPGEMFVKSWRLKNVGDTIWNNGYQLLVAYTTPFASPQRSHAIFIRTTNLIDFSISTWGPRQYNVGKDQEVDLVIPLQAPKEPGDYVAEFFLVNQNNELIYPKFWIQFKVVLSKEAVAATAFAEQQLTATVDTSEVPALQDTPQPKEFDWSGEWLIRDPFSDMGMIPQHAWLMQDGEEVLGFFYDTDDEPVLIEGRTENYGQRLKGKFAQPWQNKAIAFEWRLLHTGDQFYSVTATGATEFGSVCGGRNGKKFPDTCSLPKGD